MEDTQSVGSSTWVISPRHSILSRCSLTFRHKAIGHFLGACIMGWISCWSWILSLPENLPISVNQSGNSFIKSSVDLMDLAAAGTVAGLTFVAVVEAGAGFRGFVLGCMTVTYNSSSQLLAFHMMEGLGWQDQMCLQHTNMNWSCKVECQGCLAAQQWAMECTI